MSWSTRRLPLIGEESRVGFKAKLDWCKACPELPAITLGVALLALGS